MRSAVQHQILIAMSGRRARCGGSAMGPTCDRRAKPAGDSAAAKLAFAHHTLVVVTKILHPVLIVGCLAGQQLRNGIAAARSVSGTAARCKLDLFADGELMRCHGHACETAPFRLAARHRAERAQRSSGHAPLRLTAEV